MVTHLLHFVSGTLSNHGNIAIIEVYLALKTASKIRVTFTGVTIVLFYIFKAKSKAKMTKSMTNYFSNLHMVYIAGLFLTTKSDNNHASSVWLSLCVISLEYTSVEICISPTRNTCTITLWDQSLYLYNFAIGTASSNCIASFSCALQLLILSSH